MMRSSWLSSVISQLASIEEVVTGGHSPHDFAGAMLIVFDSRFRQLKTDWYHHQSATMAIASKSSRASRVMPIGKQGFSDGMFEASRTTSSRQFQWKASKG